MNDLAMQQAAPLQKLLHTFAALADLGQEIADTHDFDEKMRAALHLVQGSLGIMRGSLAVFEADGRTLKFIAARGMGENLPADIIVSPEEIAGLFSLGICGLTGDDTSPAVADFC
ncbi:MAG TPA: hypothetical protein VEV81_02245, partial [Pyrinomonadaceae bacterium]|nr:hypothetical protein [Pyrinomonadaceae bacterium]